jgi:hypothetical protein
MTGLLSVLLVLSTGDFGTEPPPPAEPIGCASGMALDPTGHCCWPGQVWGEQTHTCRGRPACPEPLVAAGERCQASCAPGQQLTPDTLHCCWANQEWSHAVNQCIGTPRCPAGLAVNAAETACEPAMAPPAVPTTGTAPPVCDPPNVKTQEGCLTPREKWDEDQAARYGDNGIVFGLGYAFIGAPLGGVYGHTFEGTLGWHPRGWPLFAHIDGGIGGYYAPKATCNLGEGFCSGLGEASGLIGSWRVGVAYAPWEGPKQSEFSPWNPFIGPEVLGVHFGSPGGTTCSNAPLCGSARWEAPDRIITGAISAGDVMFVGGQSLVFRVTVSAAPSGPIVAGTVELPGLVVLLAAALAAH